MGTLLIETTDSPNANSTRLVVVAPAWWPTSCCTALGPFAQGWDSESPLLAPSAGLRWLRSPRPGQGPRPVRPDSGRGWRELPRHRSPARRRRSLGSVRSDMTAARTFHQHETDSRPSNSSSSVSATASSYRSDTTGGRHRIPASDAQTPSRRHAGRNVHETMNRLRPGDLYRQSEHSWPRLERLSLSKAPPAHTSMRRIYMSQRFRLHGGFDLRQLAADPLANTGVAEPGFGVCTPRSGRFSTPHQ
jgi:hypothetical protein